MFTDVYGAPDLVEGAIFWSEIQVPDSYVTRSSNASGRSSGSLRRTHNSERRYPDAVVSSPGPIGAVPKPDFARVIVLG